MSVNMTVVVWITLTAITTLVLYGAGEAAAMWIQSKREESEG